MEALQFTLDDVEQRARYDSLFEQCPSAFIQQSTYWAEAIQSLGPDKPIFLLCYEGDQDLAGLPLYLFEHSLGNVLTSIPQPGPLGGVFSRDHVPPSQRNKIYELLLSRAECIARERGCVSMTIITNPFDSDLHLYRRYLEPDFVFENFTQYIPVRQIIRDDNLQLPDYYQRQSYLSRNLRRAQRAGFSLEICQKQADLQAWYQVHCQRHEELGVAPLSFDLLCNLYRVLGSQGKAALLLVRRSADIASGCFYVYHKAVMDVFMLSDAPEYRQYSPNFLNTLESLKWAAERGIETYNWQSSPTREGGVYAYKSLWGSIETPYYFVTRLFESPARIQKLGRDTISREYPQHYVVPFGAFEAGFDTKYFKKDAAGAL